MARLVVKDGWTQALAPERFSVGITTVRRWVERYRQVQATGRVPTRADMRDLSSRPRRCPHQLDRRTERRIVGLRVSAVGASTRRLPPGPEPLHGPQGPPAVPLPAAEVDRPGHRDPSQASRANKNSYVCATPGDLVHVDIKKLGRIPAGGGWQFRGRKVGRHNKQKARVGYAYLHHAVDDHSRLPPRGSGGAPAGPVTHRASTQPPRAEH
jgi:hypothetical protein